MMCLGSEHLGNSLHSHEHIPVSHNEEGKLFCRCIVSKLSSRHVHYKCNLSRSMKFYTSMQALRLLQCLTPHLNQPLSTLMMKTKRMVTVFSWRRVTRVLQGRWHQHHWFMLRGTLCGRLCHFRLVLPKFLRFHDIGK